MRQSSQWHHFLVVSIIAIIMLPSPLRAQCNEICGDVNVSGSISSSDFIRLMDYLYQNPPFEIDTECADVDDYDLITLRDVSYLNVYVFAAGAAPICPSGNSRIVPVPTLNYRVEHSGLFPANDSTFAMRFQIRSLVRIRGINLAIQIKVDGETPNIDSVGAYHFGLEWQSRRVLVDPAGAPPASISAGFLMLGNALDSGVYEMMTVYLSMSPSSDPRLVTVDHIQLPPIMDDEFGVPTPVSYTMILDQPNDAWGLDSNACRIWNTGDMNLDLGLTSADIIWIVNYVFKSGADPLPCDAAADVNCSGTVTSSDIISLVNHVFKSGSPPCDVCTLVPGMWTCL